MESGTIDRLGELWLPYGALGAAAVVLAAVVLGRPAPGDLPFAAALVVGVTAGRRDLPVDLVVGLVALALFAWVARLDAGAGWRRRAVEAGGGLVLGGTVGLRGWGLAVCAVGVPVLAAALAGGDERRPGLGAWLLVISVVGVWTTVPDTEEATALLGGAAVVAGVGLLTRLRCGGVGAAVGAGAVMVTVVVGGLGRDGAVVGAAVAVAAVGLEPAIRWLTGRRNRLSVVVVTHVVLVAAACRVAGLRESAVDAAVLSGLAALAAAGVLLIAPTEERTTPL